MQKLSKNVWSPLSVYPARGCSIGRLTLSHAYGGLYDLSRVIRVNGAFKIRVHPATASHIPGICCPPPDSRAGRHPGRHGFAVDSSLRGDGEFRGWRTVYVPKLSVRTTWRFSP